MMLVQMAGSAESFMIRVVERAAREQENREDMRCLSGVCAPEIHTQHRCSQDVWVPPPDVLTPLATSRQKRHVDDRFPSTSKLPRGANWSMS